MGGGLIQLVAYGSQDMYLTGNPQITFFKVVYRRHTNFSMESVKQTGGEADFGKTVSWTIQRNGDLIHRMYLQVALPEVKITTTSTQHKAFRWLNWIGHVLCKNIELTIGGTKIDKQSGVNSPESTRNVPSPAGIEAPEKENPRTTPSLMLVISPAAAAAPPEAPSTQPLWLN